MCRFPSDILSYHSRVICLRDATAGQKVKSCRQAASSGGGRSRRRRRKSGADQCSAQPPSLTLSLSLSAVHKGHSAPVHLHTHTQKLVPSIGVIKRRSSQRPRPSREKQRTDCVTRVVIEIPYPRPRMRYSPPPPLLLSSIRTARLNGLLTENNRLPSINKG